MRSPIFRPVRARTRQAILRRRRGQIDHSFPRRRRAPFPNSGNLFDPLRGTFRGLRQFGVGDHPFRQVCAEAVNERAQALCAST